MSDFQLIPTNEFLAACRAAGLKLDEPKARGMRVKGWLPPAIERAGKGQGRGREKAWWDVSCVDRCIIIARAPRSASKNLFANGYWVWGDFVPQRLAALADIVDEVIKKQRKFLDSDLDPLEIMIRLIDSVARRNKNVPRDQIKAMSEYIVGVAGMANLMNDSAYAQVADFFSLLKIRDTIKSTSCAEMEEIHRAARAWTRNFSAMMGLFVFGTLALQPDATLLGLEGPSLTFTGINLIKTYRKSTSEIIPSYAQFNLELVALLVKVIAAKYSKMFENTVLNAAASLVQEVVIPLVSNDAPYLQALRNLPGAINQYLKKA